MREDVFFAWLHKFTGIVIDTSKAPNVMVSFTADRLQKMKELLLSVDWSVTHLTLGLVQTVSGNLMWITKVYTMLTAWLAPWRRAMQGVTSNAEPSQIVSTKMPNETEALSTKKLRKDTHMLVQFLDHMMAMKQEHGEQHQRCMNPDPNGYGHPHNPRSNCRPGYFKTSYRLRAEERIA